MATLGAILSTSSVSVLTQPTATPGSTVTLTVVSGNDHVAAWTAGEAESVVISGTHLIGNELTCIILNDATPRTITFSTGFSASATVVGTASRRAVVKFISNGTTFYEVSRTLLLV